MGRLRPGLGVLAETQSDGQARLRGTSGPSWSPVTCSISVSTSIMHQGCDSPPEVAVFPQFRWAKRLDRRSRTGPVVLSGSVTRVGRVKESSMWLVNDDGLFSTVQDRNDLGCRWCRTVDQNSGRQRPEIHGLLPTGATVRGHPFCPLLTSVERSTRTRLSGPPSLPTTPVRAALALATGPGGASRRMINWVSTLARNAS